MAEVVAVFMDLEKLRTKMEQRLAEGSILGPSKVEHTIIVYDDRTRWNR